MKLKRKRELAIGDIVEVSDPRSGVAIGYVMELENREKLLRIGFGNKNKNKSKYKGYWTDSSRVRYCGPVIWT